MSATSDTAAGANPQIVDFELSSELQQFRDKVREYATTKLGDAQRWDREASFPREAVKAAAAVAPSTMSPFARTGTSTASTTWRIAAQSARPL